MELKKAKKVIRKSFMLRKYGKLVSFFERLVMLFIFFAIGISIFAPKSGFAFTLVLSLIISVILSLATCQQGPILVWRFFKHNKGVMREYIFNEKRALESRRIGCQLEVKEIESEKEELNKQFSDLELGQP